MLTLTIQLGETIQINDDVSICVISVTGNKAKIGIDAIERVPIRHEGEVELIALPEVRKITGLGTTKLYEMIGQGKFPRQVPIGTRTVRWVKSEVQQWAINQIESARGPRNSRS